MKKELTNRQKVIVLKRVRKAIKKDYTFLCVLIYNAVYSDCFGKHIREDTNIINSVSPFELIPELLDYKPKVKYTDMIWFSINAKGKQQRLDIIDKLLKRFEVNI
jgi:hypothetical protein